MPQNRLQKHEPSELIGTDLETACTSRRSLCLGVFGAAGALALGALSTPAIGAVSMLRTGLDPDALETEGDLEEVGRWYWYGRRRRRRRRRWRWYRRGGIWIRIW